MINKYLEELENMLESPRLYFHPFTAETVNTYLQGFNQGLLTSNALLDFNDIVHTRRDAIIIRGWSNNSLRRLESMKTKQMSEEEIIKEFINIEIDTWRLLESDEKSKKDII